MSVFENLFNNALFTGIGFLILIWFIGQFIMKLGNSEGRKEITDELKKEKFVNTEVFVIVFIILVILTIYLD